MEDQDSVVHLPDGREIHFPATMSDDDITKAVASLTSNTQTHDSKPENALSYPAAVADHVKRGVMEIGGKVGRIARNHPVAIGAGLGAMAAVPTGGASLLPSLTAAGLGAAGGAGVGGMVSAATGAPDAPTTPADVYKQMGIEGAAGFVGEGVGRAAMTGLRFVGRQAYRYALAPTERLLDKYGDIVGHGLRTKTPVSISGMGQATERQLAGQAEKQLALEGAGSVDPNAVVKDARATVGARGEALMDAGELGPQAHMGAQIDRFAARHAPLTISQPPTVVPGQVLPDSVDAAVRASNELPAGVRNNIPTAVFGGDDPAAVAAARQIGPMANLVPRRLLGHSQHPSPDLVFGEGIPAPGLPAAKADAIKQTLDNRLGLAHRKLRNRDPLTIREEERLALKNALSQEIEATLPAGQYKEMNRGIMDDFGLSRAIKRRTTGSGGNQGLENLALFFGGGRMLPGRLASLPAVSSRLGIAAHGAGTNQVTGDMLRSAIIALMDPEHQDGQ